MVKTNNVRSCYNCKYCQAVTERKNFNMGDKNVDIDYRCLCSGVSYKFLNDFDFNFDIMADSCRWYRKKEKTYNCLVCNKEFKYDKETHKYWVQSIIQNTSQPVCSHSCKKLYDDKDPRILTDAEKKYLGKKLDSLSEEDPGDEQDIRDIELDDSDDYDVPF